MIINSIIGDADKFFSAGWDAKVIMWDLDRLAKVTELPVEGYVNTMALDGVNSLYIGGANGFISALKIAK